MTPHPVFERTPDTHEASSTPEASLRSAITASVVHEAVRLEGEEELARPASALAWSALAAGISMGASLLAEGFLRHRLPDEPWRPLVSKLGYAIGFLLVTIGRQQLYTENTLTAVLPTLHRRTRGAVVRMLRLWAVVLVMNLTGAALFAAYFAYTRTLESTMVATLAEIGRGAGRWTALETFLRGIPAGWLIALIVWLGPAVPGARHVITLLLAYVVGLGELTHVIAGSVEVMFHVMVGGTTWGDYFLDYLLPSLFGNTVGGVVIVALLNHAQVVAGTRDETPAAAGVR